MLSHPQFEYDRARAVFGNRSGWGPLLILPDTNLLIHLVEAFDSVESHFGIPIPLPPGDHNDPVAALRDLFALWFHRDLRWVVSEQYLHDASKPLSERRQADRRRVLDALHRDLMSRGGTQRASVEWDLADDERAAYEQWCADDEHSRRSATALTTRAEELLPGYDGRLAADALRQGCHVFLTEDRGILKRAGVLFGWGLTAMRPGTLLDRLDEAGEFRPDSSGLVPDLLSLAQFYAIQPE
jgi:hypothetical protein